MCYNLLQCVAVYCSVLQHVAVCCSAAAHHKAQQVAISKSQLGAKLIAGNHPPGGVSFLACFGLKRREEEEKGEGKERGGGCLPPHQATTCQKGSPPEGGGSYNQNLLYQTTRKLNVETFFEK